MPSKKKETIKGLIELIKWNQRYNKEDITDIVALLKPYSEKMKVFTKADEAVDYVNGSFCKSGAQGSRPTN